MSTQRGSQGSIGQTIARVLTGSWRQDPPQVDIPPEELERAIPLLLRSGAGALAWRQLQHAKLPSNVSRVLRESYVAYAVRGAQHEQAVTHVFRVLHGAGIDPILIKGWAAARQYPESGLRPSGDIDLCVSPEQRFAAELLLNSPKLEAYRVDLKHDEIDKFGELQFADLYSCSQQVTLQEVHVRILGPEDRLRVLCVHLIKHGAWRPLWLCDIGASLESLPGSFSLARCLGTNPRHAEWVRCVLGLACRLLDAKSPEVPVDLPRWLVPAVLKQWSRAYDSTPPPMRDALRVLRQRWRNPIQATVDADAAFDNWPRFPLQLRDFVTRAVRFIPKVCTINREDAGSITSNR